MSDMITEIHRPDKEMIARASAFSAATLLEAADKSGALPSGIKPLSTDMRVIGPAVTVSSPPGDNLLLHEAIVAAKPGDVLIVEASGYYEAGYWGDIMTHAALARGIAGLVIDGCVRDGNDIRAMNFPVFSRGLCIRGTSKHGGGTINHPINIGDVRISPGDLVVGDGDGIVIIPRAKIPEVLAKAQAREEQEEQIRELLKKGKTTLEIYGWPSPLV